MIQAIDESNDEIVNVENDWNALSTDDKYTGIISASDDEIEEDDNSNVSDDESTYSELSDEIGSGGNIELQHDYYTYDSGSTITISTSGVINGKRGNY